MANVPLHGVLFVSYILTLCQTKLIFFAHPKRTMEIKHAQSPWLRIIWFKKEIKKSHVVSYMRPAFLVGLWQKTLGVKLKMIDKNKKGLISVINQSFMDLSDSWHRIVSMSTVSVESWSLQIKHQFFIILTGYMSCSLLLSRKFSQYRQILYKKKKCRKYKWLFQERSIQEGCFLSVYR